MVSSNLKFPTDTRFLVTGAAGFIGSNLVEALLELGHKVRGLDNLSTGSMENINSFLNNSNFEFIKGDIRDYITCFRSCKGVDYVLHHAALVSVPGSIEKPLLYEEVNIRGTLNMLESARCSSVKKFIYASSSAVYGNGEDIKKQNDYDLNLLSPYALTKKTNEQYGCFYQKVYGLETFGLRYFNVFGKRQDPNGPYAAVIPVFINQLLENKNPIIHGDGMQSRDFTHVDNIIQANLLACKAASKNSGQVYNIANGENILIIDLFNKLRKLLNKDVEPLFGPTRQGDIKDSIADISKAEEQIGYFPICSFDDGIEATIDWYISERNLKRKYLQL